MNRISENLRGLIAARKMAAGTNARRLITISSPFILLLFLLGMATAYQVGRFSSQGVSGNPPEDLGTTFEPFWETWNLAQKHYVNQSVTQNQQLTQGAIKGLLDSLGDTGHTTYLTREEYEQYVSFMKGEGKGIGVRLTLQKGLPAVLETFAGSPARAAGLRPGDVLYQVDGIAVIRLPIAKIVGMLGAGPTESIVHVRILRGDDQQPRDYYVARDQVDAPPVVWQSLPGTRILHVAIGQFDARTPRLLRMAVEEARKEELQGLILDLRGCAGGLVGETLAVTNEFLREGIIVFEQDTEGNLKTRKVNPGGRATDIPMCVLIDEKTASSAELMAGALKDNGRAKLIGTRTAGMGTMLHPFKLQDGAVVFLAIAEWLTPNGHRIWHNGVAPDLKVHLPDGVEPFLPKSETGLAACKISECRDSQLLKAIEVVQKHIRLTP